MRGCSKSLSPPPRRPYYTAFTRRFARLAITLTPVGIVVVFVQGWFRSCGVPPPNGHRIVYVHEGNRCRTLHVMRSDGTDDQRLPRSCPAEYPAWSPNGIKVAFNPHPEMGGRLWSMSMNGTHKMLVTRGDDPDWQLRFK